MNFMIINSQTDEDVGIPSMIYLNSTLFLMNRFSVHGDSFPPLDNKHSYMCDECLKSADGHETDPILNLLKTALLWINVRIQRVNVVA